MCMNLSDCDMQVGKAKSHNIYMIVYYPRVWRLFCRFVILICSLAMHALMPKFLPSYKSLTESVKQSPLCPRWMEQDLKGPGESAYPTCVKNENQLSLDEFLCHSFGAV